MRISIFQFSPEWLNHQHNLQEVARTCKSLAGKTDLLLLPEMFSTGYILDTCLLSSQWQEEMIDALTKLANENQMKIGGSIPFFRSGRWFNTFVFVDENGIMGSYDKIQLFAPAGEKAYYSQGDKIQTLSILKWQIQPLICYDLRFPYLSFASQSPDLLIYSANWPVTRVHHWKSLLIARAIENQCYVIGVNRTGSDENGFEYPGASMVIDYNGIVLSEMDHQPGVVTISLNAEDMKNFRDKLPFASDRIDKCM